MIRGKNIRVENTREIFENCCFRSSFRFHDALFSSRTGSRGLSSMLRKWDKERESSFEPAFKVNTLTIAFFAHVWSEGEGERGLSRKSRIFSESGPNWEERASLSYESENGSEVRAKFIAPLLSLQIGFLISLFRNAYTNGGYPRPKKHL